MARGWSNSSQNSTLRKLPFRLLTSSRFVSESAQYSFSAIQSQARPSGDTSPETMISSAFLGLSIHVLLILARLTSVQNTDLSLQQKSKAAASSRPFWTMVELALQAASISCTSRRFASNKYGLAKKKINNYENLSSLNMIMSF